MVSNYSNSDDQSLPSDLGLSDKQKMGLLAMAQDGTLSELFDALTDSLMSSEPAAGPEKK